MGQKITNVLGDTFVYRMSGKGFSDQSDVPADIHKNVFDRVMKEFIEKYGASALNTVFTGYEEDVEIGVYKK